MACSGSVGQFRCGWTDDDRAAASGEGRRSSGKRGGAGRGHPVQGGGPVPTLTFRDLAAMTAGELIQGGDIVTSSVVIDSREVKPDSVFFAIKGERLDGHRFIQQALATARGAVVSEIPDGVPRDKGIVKVPDTTMALHELARAIRDRFAFTLVGATGSGREQTPKDRTPHSHPPQRRSADSCAPLN